MTWSTGYAAFCEQPSVGHLGTLDPLATGVLPLVVGNLTRLAQFYGASEKTYEGVDPLWLCHRHLRFRRRAARPATDS